VVIDRGHSRQIQRDDSTADSQGNAQCSTHVMPSDAVEGTVDLDDHGLIEIVECDSAHLNLSLARGHDPTLGRVHDAQ